MKLFTQETLEQVKEWIDWYCLCDTETALKRAIRKVFKGTSPEQQTKLIAEYEGLR